MYQHEREGFSHMDFSVATGTKTVPNSMFHLSERNRQAVEIIKGYALAHTLTDVGIGVVGTAVPIPGAGFAAMVASMLVQAPLFYQPMVRKLAEVYAAPSDALLQGLVTRETGIGVFGDLASEFGTAFLRKVIVKILWERNVSFAASFIPVLGGVASAVLDATFATTLTWRIGKMAAIYFHYDGWIHTQEETYERAKAMTPWSLHQEDNLADIPARNPEVQDKQRVWIATLVQELKQRLPERSTDHVRMMLEDQGVSAKMIDAALQ